MRLSPSPFQSDRPRLLVILCILSGIAAVYGAVNGLGGALFPPEVDSGYVDNLLERLSRLDLPPGFEKQIEAYYVNLTINFGNLGAANFLFYAVQFIGVVLMFQRNRIGFVLYVCAQLGLAGSTLLFGGVNSFGLLVFVLAVLWSAVWIFAYARLLKYFPAWKHRT